ncbi:Regulator of G-protein signaling 3 [Tyrophagus putrescentiae]|nr:Regulator of G-protein signaling 3 [Tyrophagus putrescentiae]
MKQRLRFLRRRHTDSSLHASTVRPPRNEVEKWSKSFRDLMANRYGCALFRAFLSREYSEENIEFWIACEEYRKARSSKLHHKARKIFDRFLAVCAPKEVNLDPQLRADILQMLSTPHKTTFDEAQRRIQSLLESDSYLRFLTSDIYTQLLNSEQERKKDEAEEAAEAAAAASMAESELLESDDARTPTPSTSRLGGRTRQPTSSSSNLASSPFLEDDC